MHMSLLEVKHVLIALALLVVALGMYACGEKTASPACANGETKACTCASGEAGEMTCSSGGWSVCDCNVDGDVDSDMSDNPGDCEEGHRYCVGDSLFVCESGLWVQEKDCRTDGLVCRSGMCTDPESDGDAEAGESGESEFDDLCNDTIPCGNPDLYCFMPRPGEDGRCMAFCDHEDNCPEGFDCDSVTSTCVLRQGYCVQDDQCFLGREYCGIGPGQDAGQCKAYCYMPAGGCLSYEICCTEHSTEGFCEGYTGRCVNPNIYAMCDGQEDCPVTAYCEILAGKRTGYCRWYCNEDSHCPEGLVCREDRRCGVGMQDGDCGGTCPLGSLCDPLFNQCLPDCLDCGPLDYCDFSTAPNCIPGGCRVNPTVCGLLLPPCCIGYTCTTTVYGKLGHCI